MTEPRVDGAVVADENGAVEVPAEDLVNGGEVDIESQELSKGDHVVIDAVVNAVGPVAMRLGFGGFVGFCSGFFLKKAAKVAAGVLGFGFVCLQGLQYCGYVEVKWAAIKRDLVRTVDSDGTGTVGVKDVRHHVTRLYRIMRFHGPPATGFGFGLYLGFQEA